MDCPSEESLIRMKLEGLPMIKRLVFDIENRKLTVFHSEENPEIEKSLKELNLGAEHKETIIVHQDEFIDNTSVQSKLLWTVLIINFAFFILEITTGFISKSMGFGCRFTGYAGRCFRLWSKPLGSRFNGNPQEKSSQTKWLFSTGIGPAWSYRGNTQVYQF